MRILETYLYRLCVLICLCGSCYIGYLQFKQYLKNDDLASISYRKFNNEEKDEYPTISICILGPTGWIFDSSHDGFKSTNATPESYHNYLRGSLKEYPAEFIGIKFEDVALDIQKRFSIRFYEYFLQDGDELEHRRSPLIPAYQDPTKVCISKDSSFRKGAKQISDRLVFNSSKLYTATARIRIHIHQKGKLLRNLWYPIFTPRRSQFKSAITKIIDVGKVDILRERAKGETPCDQNMKDEDEYIINQSIKNIGCVPTFWEKVKNRTENHQTIRMCKSTTDYRKAARHGYGTFKTIGELDSMYKNPCTVMLTSITTRDEQKSSDPTQGLFKLRFHYNQNLYREIINSQAYTSEALLGQVGGIVGTVYHFVSQSNIFIILIVICRT